MKQKLIIALAIAALGATTTMQAQEVKTIKVCAESKIPKTDAPVVISLKDYGRVTSAKVTYKGIDQPYQLDDTDGDGNYDELCFLTDFEKKEKRLFEIELYSNGAPKKFEPRVFAEIVQRNSKVSEKNKHNIYLNSISFERGINSYSLVHHHGVAFESELICARIYFDHRQAVDLYGKKHKRLELKDTQFYPSAQQLAEGYGDDVLWVGKSVGLGAMWAWDGEKGISLEDVDHRTQKIIANGPLRTIVEIEDYNWRPTPSSEQITMKTRYTVYAGHRDIFTDIKFSRPAAGYEFLTGLVNVNGSTEFSDHKGLRGCWGSAWAVGGKDTLTHKKETVGLGIYIPSKYNKTEKAANADNYPFIIATDDDQIHYRMTYTSDNEDFGYHSAKDWFDYLKKWRKEIENETTITIE